MNLEEALVLRERAEREIKAATITYNAVRDHFYGSNIPDEGDCLVVTDDGKEFSLMTFSGAYSDYHYTTHESPEGWDRYSADWKSVLFNPEGEWKHRVIVHLEKNEYGDMVGTLDCGHEVRDFYLDPGPWVGKSAECRVCRTNGVGLNPEKVARIVDGLLSDPPTPEVAAIIEKKRPVDVFWQNLSGVSLDHEFTIGAEGVGTVEEATIERPDGKVEPVPFTLGNDDVLRVKYTCELTGPYRLRFRREIAK